MNEKILTICTAAYNADKYIKTLIESIMKCENKEFIEHIIIDDGSTDDTEQTVKPYIEQYPHIFKYIKKENGGSGSAWNVGFKNATAKYIKIIDADDYIISDNLDKYLDELKIIDVDIIWNQFFKKYEKTGETMCADFTKGKLRIGQEYDITKDSIELANDFEMHGITYRTELIQNNNITISEGISYCDIEYLMLPIPYCRKLIYFELPFYVYRLELDGQSVDPNIVIKRESHFRTISKRLLAYYKTNKKNASDIQKEIMIKVVAKAVLGIYNSYYLRCDYKLKNELKALDICLKSDDYDIWKQVGETSGSAKLLRKNKYFGYYLMVLYHRFRNHCSS